MSNTNTILLTIGIVLAFAVIFPLWWCFVVWLISRFGWSQLAERYGTEQQPWGNRLGGQSMRVNGSRYSHTIVLTTNDVGLFAEPTWIFRFGHKRLFIPWLEMHNPRPAMLRIWPLVALDVGFPATGSIAVAEDVLRQGPEAAQRILSEERSAIA